MDITRSAPPFVRELITTKTFIEWFRRAGSRPAKPETLALSREIRPIVAVRKYARPIAP